MAITDVKEGRYRDTFQFREIIKTISCRASNVFSPFFDSSFVLQRGRDGRMYLFTTSLGGYDATCLRG